MTKMRYIFIILSLFSTLFCASQKNKRVALIIGNADYAFTTKLENTVNDAKVIADALKKVQFQVIYKENLNRKDFLQQLSAFITLVNDSSCEAGFFYYAGHGIQFENNNFLVPVDAKIENPVDVEDACVNLQKLNRIVATNNKVMITVLDACRTNPFESSRSIGNGGLVKINAVSGSLIAYSTEPGKVAMDGKGSENSIYSKTLARYIIEPNLALEQVFKLVRNEVEEKTGNKQSPREESALKGEVFYFNKKTDYSKVDIKDIENEMNSLLLNKKYHEALVKGSVLQNIYKDRNDTISRLKYVTLLIKIAKLNWQAVHDTINPIDQYQWINYYKNASIALNEAIKIFTNNGLNSNSHKFLFSKLLANYIQLQSLINQNDRIISNSALYSMSDQLIAFNEHNFGLNDYKTAYSYFDAGYAKKDTLPLESYNLIKTAYKVIVNTKDIEFNSKEEYSFDDMNMNFYIIKWNIQALNNLIDLSPKTTEIDKLLLFNPQLLYQTTKSEIQSNITYLESIKHPRINQYIYQCSRFYNNYALILNDQLSIKLTEDAINTNDKGIKYCTNYVDSINNFSDQIRLMQNLLEIKYPENHNNISINPCELIFNRLNECIKLAHNNNDSYQTLITTENFINRSRILSKYNKNCFNNQNLYAVLDKFNDVFNDLIAEYKLSDNKNGYNDYINQYFTSLREYFWANDSVNYRYKIVEADQYVEWVSNCNLYSYGSPKYLAALEHRAVVLGQSSDINDLEESEKEYIKLIKLNKQYSPKWNENDLVAFVGNKNKEEAVSLLLSDCYFNYHLNVIDKIENLNNSNDSILIHSYLKFTEEYKVPLFNINRFYNSKVSAIKLMVLYYNVIDQKMAIDYCNQGISILKERLDVDTNKAKLDNLSNYFAESDITWFFDQKLNNIKKSKPSEYSKIAYEYKEIANKFKAYDKFGTLLYIYNNLTDYYFFSEKNFNLVKKAAKEAYSEYGKYFNSTEFLSSDFNAEYKLYLKTTLNHILSRLAESSLLPKKEDRKLCIDECRKTVDFIYKTWNINEIKENIYVLDVLKFSLYTIEDLSYFLGDYKTAIEFADKQLGVVELYKDNDVKVEKKLQIQRSKAGTHLKANDTLNATLSYLSYVSNIKNLDTSICNNIKYSFEKKIFQSCSVPYFHFTIFTPLNSYPCIEFDINCNSKIDSLIDLRYFIDINSVLTKENIKSLKHEIGGYYIFGFDEFGNKIDTSQNIFFDKTKSLKTHSYFQTQKAVISSDIKFGNLKIGDQINKWDIFIPIEEIKFEKNDCLSMIYSNISVQEQLGTLSRRYEKNTIPVKSYYTGFKDAIKIKVE
jgi:hypothetical protein